MTVPDVQLSFHDVWCTPGQLLEMEGAQAMVTVPRAEIRRITLHHGLQAPHPILQIGMGLALVSVGYFPVLHLMHWLSHGGLLFEAELWVVPLVVLGLWLIVKAMKRGYFLDVELAAGRKRLSFSGRPEAASLRGFTDLLEKTLGLRIQREVIT